MLIVAELNLLVLTLEFSIDWADKSFTLFELLLTILEQLTKLCHFLLLSLYLICHLNGFLLMFLHLKLEVHFCFPLSGEGFIELVFYAFDLFEKVAVLLCSQLNLMLSLYDNILVLENLMSCIFFLKFTLNYFLLHLCEFFSDNFIIYLWLFFTSESLGV